jgi:TolB-like protein
MVQPNGDIKLLDFGIARRIVFDTAPTRTGTLNVDAVSDTCTSPQLMAPGTIPYMAPELLSGGSTDARSDLFSVGVLLYECTVRQRPFQGVTPAEVFQNIASGTPEPIRARDPRVPPTLAHIIHRLLEKEPAARYQTARTVHDELASVLRDLELDAMRPAVLADRRTVAVLPFALLTPNPVDEYLSCALADAVINHLSAGGSLLVRPTSAVMRYATQAIDPLRAGTELNVEIIVDGSVQRVERRLRVHVQARTVCDGLSLMSSRHEADAVDLFGLQDAVAAAIGTASARPAQPCIWALNPQVVGTCGSCRDSPSHGAQRAQRIRACRAGSSTLESSRGLQGARGAARDDHRVDLEPGMSPGMDVARSLAPSSWTPRARAPLADRLTRVESQRCLRG